MANANKTPAATLQGKRIEACGPKASEWATVTLATVQTLHRYGTEERARAAVNDWHFLVRKVDGDWVRA